MDFNTFIIIWGSYGISIFLAIGFGYGLGRLKECKFCETKQENPTLKP
jgi:hypothetical protein